MPAKSYNKPTKKTSPPWAWIGAAGLLIVIVAVAVFCVKPKSSIAPTTNDVDNSIISITTADGIKLAATEKYPVRNVLSPAVILIHQFGGNRHQWDQYIQAFLDQGIAVVSYDIRGFGDSPMPTIPTDQTTYLNQMPTDLTAVVNYVKSQVNIDPQKINVIGASIGADIAFVGAGSNLGINKTVLLSPAIHAGALDGQGVTNFSPHSIFGLSDEAEKIDLQKIMDRVAEPKKLTITPETGHGIELLTQTGTLDDTIKWILQ